MNAGNVHEAARASLKREDIAKKKRKRRKPATKVAAKPIAAPSLKTAAKAATKRSVKKPGKSTGSLKRKLHGAAHAMSAGISALMGLLALSAVMLTSNESAAQPEAKASLLTAPLRDIDFDGVGDFANPTDGFVRPHDHYGYGDYGASRDGGRRKHAGVDYMAKPGRLVRAPVTGRVTRVGFAYNRRSGLNFVEIHDTDRNLFARVFYVAASVRPGDTIAAGAPIGSAQDLTLRYPSGITNHVHVEILDERGVHVDPSLLLPLPSYDLAAVEQETPTAAAAAP